MKIKQLLVLLALPLLSSLAHATKISTPIVTIKSELASPVILENTQDKNYLKISLTGFPLETQRRSPINLSLVIDRSTSMSGDRIEKAREAAILAVNMMDKEDTISIVAYDNQAEVIIPATKVNDKEKLISAINKHIRPTGMTALFAGVSKGLEQVSKNLDRDKVNRIILLSDGQANRGPTSTSEISELARTAAKKGIAITTIGLGRGYNEDLMTALAGYSDGNHAFVDNSADLEKAFSREFKDVMSVVAQDVVITIKVNKDVKPVRLLGRDGEITGDTVKVKLNQLYSNQEKYVLLEVIPAKGANTQEKSLAKVSVNYDNLSTKKKESFNEDIAVRYTKSSEAVKAAVIEDVLVESEIQKAAIANEEAIKLMDAGNKDQAQAIMSSNVQKLRSLSVASPAAQMKVEQSAKMNMELSEAISEKDANYSRKMMKEQVYNTKNQQSTPSEKKTSKK